MITQPWRLIVDEPDEGRHNMAVDRALQVARETGRSPATLRLYGWCRPTVSIGRLQDAQAVDVDACAAERIPVVRRSTGGRAVVHDDEVTYSVVAGTEDGLPRRVTASYRLIAGALTEAYRELGVEVAPSLRSPRSSSAACYLTAMGGDLARDGVKLSGSAQVWLRDTCLQHGSIVRSRDVGLEARALGLGSSERARYESCCGDLRSILGTLPSMTDIESALREAFARVFKVSFVEGELSEYEREMAAAIELDADSSEPDCRADASRGTSRPDREGCSARKG